MCCTGVTQILQICFFRMRYNTIDGCHNCTLRKKTHYLIKELQISKTSIRYTQVINNQFNILPNNKRFANTYKHINLSYYRLRSKGDSGSHREAHQTAISAENYVNGSPLRRMFQLCVVAPRCDGCSNRVLLRQICPVASDFKSAATFRNWILLTHLFCS